MMGGRSGAPLMLPPQGRRYLILPTVRVQRLLLLLLLLLLLVLVVVVVVVGMMLLLLEVVRMVSGGMVVVVVVVVVVVRGGRVPRIAGGRVALVAPVGGVGIALRRDRRRRGRRRRHRRRARLAGGRRRGLDRDQDVAGGDGRHALAGGVIAVREIAHDVMMMLLLLRRRRRRRGGGWSLIAAGVHDGRQARRLRVAVVAIHGGRAAPTRATAELMHRLILLRRRGGWHGVHPVRRRSMLRLSRGVCRPGIVALPHRCDAFDT